MKTLQLRLTSLAFAASAALSTGAAFAQSAPCDTDNDCEHGYSCQVTAVSGCAGMDCAPGEECAPVVCENVEYKTCEPATDCTSDDDCADGMGCEQSEYTVCSAMAPCAEGQECKPAESDCVTQATSQCAPRSLLGCSEAADCGAGYDCVILDDCNCTSPGMPEPGTPEPAEPPVAPAQDGGSANAGDQALIAPPAPPTSTVSVDGGAPSVDTCECLPASEGYCQAQQIVCTQDSDCPSLWTCEAGIVPGTPVGPPDEPVMGGGSGSTGASSGAPAPAAPADLIAVDDDTSAGEEATAAEDYETDADSTGAYEEIAPSLEGMCVPPSGYGTIGLPTGPGMPGGDPVPTQPPTSGEVDEGNAEEPGRGDDSVDGGAQDPDEPVFNIPTDSSEEPEEEPGAVTDPDDDVTEPGPAEVEDTDKPTTTDVNEEGGDDNDGEDPKGEEPKSEDPKGEDPKGGDKGDTDDQSVVADEAGIIDANDDAEDEDSGCAVAAPKTSSSSGAAWLLGLVGLAFLRRRR